MHAVLMKISAFPYTSAYLQASNCAIGGYLSQHQVVFVLVMTGGYIETASKEAEAWREDVGQQLQIMCHASYLYKQQIVSITRSCEICF